MNKLKNFMIAWTLALWISTQTQLVKWEIQKTLGSKIEFKGQTDTLKVNDTIEYDGKKYIVESELKNVNVSWYWGKFHWRKSADWSRFDKNKLTAAHKTLPFWTKVLVYDEKTKNSVVVKITDRWPFVKGRDLDLSEKGARLLWDLYERGHKNLKMVILKET